MSDLHLPDGLADYLAARDRQRDERVTRTLEALTPTVRRLIREAAVMGYVQGTQAPSRPIPPDSVILWTVIDACHAMPDLYPTISGARGEVQ